MTSSPARRLILGYAGLTALVYLYAALPGDPTYSGFGEAAFSTVIAGLILWGLWRGSSVAWLFAVLIDVLGLVSLYLIDPGLGLSPVLMLSIAVARLMILFSSPVRAHIWSGPHARLAPS